MTVHELSQLYYLDNEIRKDKKKLEIMRLRRGLCSPGADGMPKAPGFNGSREEELTAEILDFEAIIEAKMVLTQKERNRLERWISKIPHSLTRQIFEDRFVELMSWNEVAMDIGDGSTAERVKKICYRYLRRESEGLTDRQMAESERMSEEYERIRRERG